MRNALIVTLMVILFSQGSGMAQTPATKSVLGTVTAFNRDTKDIQVKPDNAAPVPVKLLTGTLVQRIAPGETNLKNAATISISEVAIGDRVLVSLASNGTDVVRLLVMSAADIAKRDDADRQDWNKRGISGIVSGKNGNQILLKLIKTPSGDVQQSIAVSDKTKIRRYSVDSVKFADAKPSTLGEVTVGDQVRARGERSSDGLRVDAEEVVFGTFLTRAGSVVSVDLAAKEITVKELGTGTSLSIKLTSDSTIKQMSTAADGRGPASGANVAQIIESLPAGKIEDIKPGMSVVVSATKGSQAEKVTAILLVSNADLLIRLATTPSGRGGTLVFGSAGGGGLDVLALP